MVKRVVIITLVFVVLYLLILAPRADRAQKTVNDFISFFRTSWVALTTGKKV
jgi:hypothetical protein